MFFNFVTKRSEANLEARRGRVTAWVFFFLEMARKCRVFKDGRYMLVNGSLGSSAKLRYSRSIDLSHILEGFKMGIGNVLLHDFVIHSSWHIRTSLMMPTVQPLQLLFLIFIRRRRPYAGWKSIPSFKSNLKYINYKRYLPYLQVVIVFVFWYIPRNP